MVFEDGYRFAKKVRLDANSVSHFAKQSGDFNPIHHDRVYAKRSIFKQLVVSGPQTSSLLMAFTASHFSQFVPMVGLEFSFRFKSAISADEEVKLEWMIIKSRESKKFEGQIIELRGRLTDSSGITAVGAKGSVLLSTKLA